MNDHPEELLAAYVERALDADDHARVEAHIASCERCREEVALAFDARIALGSLPQLAPPKGMAFRVRRESRGTPSRAWRLAGTAAAAAIVVAGAIFVFGSLDGGLQQETSGSGGQAPAPEAGAPAEGGGGAPLTESKSAAAEDAAEEQFALPVLPIYTESQRQYDSADLAPFARRVRDEANSAIRSGLAPNARAFFEDFDTAAFTPEIRQAIRCVLADVPPSQLIVPYRIEAATFEGAPAYVAAFLQGPTPDDAYDRIVMWVVHRETCGLMSLASQVL